MRRGGDAHARRGSRTGQRHRDRCADRGRANGGISSLPGRLYGVTAISPSNVWAVGGTNWFAPSQTLADRWNGAAWS